MGNPWVLQRLSQYAGAASFSAVEFESALGLREGHITTYLRLTRTTDAVQGFRDAAKLTRGSEKWKRTVRSAYAPERFRRFRLLMLMGAFFQAVIFAVMFTRRLGLLQV
jgi:hypothetical protein